jgi:hypothetical protein
VPVLLGPLSAEGFEPMAGLWSQVAAEARRWPGTVIADLGRLQFVSGKSHRSGRRDGRPGGCRL